MKRLWIVAVLLTAVLGAGAVRGQQSGTARGGATANVQLEAAIKKEVVDGDVKAAIELYRALAKSSDRALAAQALLRMAGCHERLGDAAEAQKLYGQLVRDYKDQTAIAAEAQAKLVVPSASGARGKTETEHPVWSAGADDIWIAGSVSADGRKVAYGTLSTKSLTVHDLVTGSDRVVALRDQDGGTPQSAAFSRDGRWLAYQGSLGALAARKYQLRVIDLNSAGLSQPRMLLDAEAVPYDWTPDGKWIAVRMTKDADTQAIGLVSTGDGSLRILKTFTWRRGNTFRMGGTPNFRRADLNGFLSPDGSQLGVELFEDGSGARDIVVLPVDGRPEIPAVTFKGDDRLMGWTPDGSVLFTSARSGPVGLWRQRLQAGRRQGEPELIRPGFVQADSLGVTTSGALYSVVRSLPGHTAKEAAFDFEAGRFLSAPKDVADTFVRSNVAPRWSPDGKRLGYFSDRGMDTSHQVLVIRTLATGETREWSLAFAFRGDNSNLWDWIDGQSVWVTGTDAEARTGFHRIDISTGQISPLLLMPLQDTGSPFQPGERTIYYRRSPPGSAPSTRETMNARLWVARDPVSGAEREITSEDRWRLRSPDGTKTYEVRGFTIVERNTSAGAEREVLTLSAPGSWHLTADGRSIIATTTDVATSAGLVVVCSLDDGAVKELFRVPSQGSGPQGFGIVLWGPDDRSILLRTVGGPNAVAYWWVPLDGRQPRPLDELAGLAVETQNGRYGFELHPGGQRLAFYISNPPPTGEQVRVLENFLPTVNGRGAGGR